MESAPNVCAVVVDKHSDVGFVQITGGDFADQRVNTDPQKIVAGESQFVLAEIRANQRCMIYGRSTVLYIRPRT